jgi:iron-sulfur cluster assembly accessory protein
MSSGPVPISFGEEPKVEKLYNMEHGKLIDLTHEAVEKVRDVVLKNPKAQGKRFRVYVEGGGCSGMQYGFTFDEQKAGDNVIACEDVEVLLNDDATPFLKGAVVDYVEDLRGSGFIVKNPLSKGECGCGVSFTV